MEVKIGVKHVMYPCAVYRLVFLKNKNSKFKYTFKLLFQGKILVGNFDFGWCQNRLGVHEVQLME